MSAVSAPCATCGLHHVDLTACSVAVTLSSGMQLARPTGSVVAGRYRILNQIHRGPMSTVYRVVDMARGETAMVLKELMFGALPPPERAEALNWFLREAHLLSTLRHRSLPVLHAGFSEHDRSYLVMEAVPGPSLEMRARYNLPSEDQVLRWGVEICEVLHFLHHQPEPIIYRDLKPANILERADTGSWYWLISGWPGVPLPGYPDTAVGTPGYAALEQYQGMADARSDIYALGATLHRLLTGYDPDQEMPFRHPPVSTSSGRNTTGDRGGDRQGPGHCSWRPLCRRPGNARRLTTSAAGHLGSIAGGAGPLLFLDHHSSRHYGALVTGSAQYRPQFPGDGGRFRCRFGITGSRLCAYPDLRRSVLGPVRPGPRHAWTQYRPRRTPGQESAAGALGYRSPLLAGRCRGHGGRSSRNRGDRIRRSDRGIPLLGAQHLAGRTSAAPIGPSLTSSRRPLRT